MPDDETNLPWKTKKCVRIGFKSCANNINLHPD